MLVVLLEDDVALHLERGSELAAGHAEVRVQERPLLHALRVRRRPRVGPVHARLNREEITYVSSGEEKVCTS